jgi:hypothetical protein
MHQSFASLGAVYIETSPVNWRKNMEKKYIYGEKIILLGANFAALTV